MAKDTTKESETGSFTGHRRKVLWIGVSLTFVLALFWGMGLFEVLELKSLDWRFETRGPREITAPVVIVGIDDDSLNGWVDDDNNYKTMPGRWTWPRNFYARLIDRLRNAGARLVVFDMVFSESTKRDRSQDQAFGEAAARAKNVIFGERYVLKANGGIKTETLIPPLEKVMRDKGHTNANKDADDFLRSFRVLHMTSDFQLDPARPNLDLVVLRQYIFGKAVKPVVDGEVIKMNELSIWHDGGGRVDVNFAGPPQTFPTVPFHDVYYGTVDMSLFKDKIVYVGSTSSVLHDNHRTPFTATGEAMPGVEIHAHLLDTMFSGQYLKRFAPWVELLLILVLGLVTSFLTFRVKAWQGFIVTLLEIGAYTLICLVAFLPEAGNIVIPMAAPIASVLISFAGIAVYKGVVEEKRAKTTRQMFSRYVSKSIVDEILKDPSKVSLGGEEKEVTILFSDVRGFTSMSEKLSAPEVVEVLNDYLTHMVDIVIGNNGTLDKYVGDAIMAVWGSPLYDPNHQLNAARTAVQMMEVLQELQVKWEQEGKPKIDIGVGLNSGIVVAGNMGHPDFKMDYTVIGDDVNLAARMESANKAMRSHVLITGSTYEGCKDLVEVIKHEPILVKGKAEPVDMIEVIGWKGQGRAAWAKPLPK